MEGIVKKSGPRSGNTVAVFGGVHGNERVGIDAVRWAKEHIEPECGTVYLVEANPPAIERNVRFVERNLNRSFLPDITGDSLEEARARELMALLDTCDALLDIHSSNSRDATPFVICQPEDNGFAKFLDFPIISFGWDSIEPGGTDGYMIGRGKVGIGIECGSLFDAAAQAERAQNTILRFLEQFGVITNSGVRPDTKPKKYLQVYKAVPKLTETLSFSRDYADFEMLSEGEIFAKDGSKEYVAEPGDRIIFPRPKTAIGNEAYILGKDIPEPESQEK